MEGILELPFGPDTILMFAVLVRVTYNEEQAQLLFMKPLCCKPHTSVLTSISRKETIFIIFGYVFLFDLLIYCQL